jgi:hypothetical protein
MYAKYKHGCTFETMHLQFSKCIHLEIKIQHGHMSDRTILSISIKLKKFAEKKTKTKISKSLKRKMSKLACNYFSVTVLQTFH